MVMSRNSSFYKDSWWSTNDGIFFFHNRGYNRLKSTEGFDGSEIDPLAECDELQCKPGWDGDPYDCEDVDECFENLHEVSYFILDGWKDDFIEIRMSLSR